MRLFSMAATGSVPARHADGRLPRRGRQLPCPGRPAGADPDSIEVTVEHATVTIQAERAPHYGDSEQVIAAEWPQGSFAHGEDPDRAGGCAHRDADRLLPAGVGGPG